MLEEVSRIFSRADSVALAMWLAFLVPFVVTLLKPRRFGSERDRILGQVHEIRVKSKVHLARDHDGEDVVKFFEAVVKESPLIVNPIKSVINRAMMVFSMTAVAAGLMLVFHDPLEAVAALDKGLLWVVFIVAILFSCLYFHGEFKVWTEYARLDQRFVATDLTRDMIVVKREAG
jgi:hypothetical protein